MGNFLSTLISGAAGAAIGLATRGPAGAIAGGINGIINGAGGPSGLGNIAPGTDLTVPLSQGMDRAYEAENLLLQGEQLRHQVAMQVQSQQFNEVQDERSEQMREMNTLRSVAMKQRESDDKVVKEFIKTAGGE